MLHYKLLKKDDVTGEYFYKGKWHSSYPYAEIERDDDERANYEDMKREVKKHA